MNKLSCYRDGLIIGFLLISVIFNVARTSDRFTRSDTTRIVVLRDAEAAVRTQWLDQITRGICEENPSKDVCQVNWVGRISRLSRNSLEEESINTESK